MARLIDLENAMDISTLYDWYITSVSQDDEPVWTEKHIDELFKDFYVIPKETSVIEVEPVNHGKWEFGRQNGAAGYWCTNCKSGFTGENAEWIAKEHYYCPKCGADMRGE